VVEISGLDVLQGEVFGPILHVMRYAAAELDNVIARIDATRYGLTLGYQPFGGERLSGSAPQAGGPDYLLPFFRQRTLSINTAAVGGDAALLRAVAE
jgi:RHH-type proline utilization regulon transcriptional repressor/proline dehydrogenase/delta 1-pyrroline-5-carboxylate dehydrogenase